MAEMQIFCDKLFGQVGGRRMSVEEFVALHRTTHVARIARQHARGGVGSRNDVRSSSYSALGESPNFLTIDANINIFADAKHHASAAATLGSLSQVRAGFGSEMAEGSAFGRFQAYLGELASSPHWRLVRRQSIVVKHNASNHEQFVQDLIAVVKHQLENIHAGEESIAEASNSIQLLSTTVSQSGGNTSAEQTLYLSIGISRSPEESGPVFYGLFFTTLEVQHRQGRKANVLTTDAQTETVLFQLDSPMLVTNEASYNRLVRTSVDDWVNSHNV